MLWGYFLPFGKSLETSKFYDLHAKNENQVLFSPSDFVLFSVVLSKWNLFLVTPNNLKWKILGIAMSFLGNGFRAKIFLSCIA